MSTHDDRLARGLTGLLAKRKVTIRDALRFTTVVT